MKLQDLKNPDFKHFSTQINKFVRKSGNIVVVTSYVTIYTYKPQTTDKGTKVTIIVDQNYRPRYQYTIYFDLSGNQTTKEAFHAKH